MGKALFKNLLAILGNSCLLWLSWWFLLIPFFPNLPILPYYFWLIVELVIIRLQKKVGDFGIRTSTTRIPDNGIDSWIVLLLTYGICAGLIWVAGTYILTPLLLPAIP